MANRERPDRVDVLIAEDDAPMRQGLRRLLERWGFHCVEAGDGQEALDLAVRLPPRCVLLDLMMPRLDGFAVARALRADPRTRTARIHCLSALADPQSRRQALEAGCEQFLIKPVDPAELLQAVREPAVLPPPVLASGLTMGQAEALLDWLENHGCTGLGVSLQESGVAVYGICPPGLRLSRDAGGVPRLVRSEGNGT
jgi:CheY-like chemotaxis protein